MSKQFNFKEILINWKKILTCQDDECVRVVGQVAIGEVVFGGNLFESSTRTVSVG
jgi:hypothetical protein